MTQADVYNLLGKSKKKWLLVKQIAKKLNVGVSSVNASLNRLLKQGLVIKKAHKNNSSINMWKWQK